MMSQTPTKKIHLVTAVAFAVGAMVGGGVFVLTGEALQQTGPSALVSFLLAGFTSRSDPSAGQESLDG